MNEAQLQKKIQGALTRAFPGSFWWKTHGNGYQRAGLPDICGVVEGLFIGLEVKMPGRLNTLTPLQSKTLKEISQARGLAEVVTDSEEAVGLVREWLTRQGR